MREPEVPGEQLFPFSVVSATQAPLLHVWQVGQVPHWSVPPQRSEIAPQAPVGQVVIGVQHDPLVQGVPGAQHCVPQVWLEGQVQRPLTQVKLAPQVLPQAPQLLVLVVVLTQVKPAAGVPQHFCPIEHLTPQAPQLLLVLRATQAPRHRAVPAGQLQVLPEQTPPLGQLTQTPPQQDSPEQQEVPAAQLPFAGTQFLDGAVGAEPEAGLGGSAAASSREGTRAPATPAARILRTFRRESGLASFRARSSN
jgi:hypothetical protein